MVKTTFGSELRRLRQAKAWTLRQLAKKVRVTAGYLSLLERDKSPTPPSEKIVFKLAKVLDVHEDELMALSGRIAQDIQNIILRNPSAVAQLLLAIESLPVEIIENITEIALSKRRDLGLD